MFRLEGVSLRYGSRELFKELNWQVGTTDRVGMVGPNGAGKTTLLKILSNAQEPDKGSFFFGRGTTFGYLPQEGILHAGRTVFEEARSVFAPLLALKDRMEKGLQDLEQIPHDDPGFEALLEDIHKLEDRFRNDGGYQIESDVGGVLKGLGFEKEDWERATETYSGGWQMRLALAKLLLQRPSLLLLDEPTNHLDLEAREWLSSYLRSYPFALVLVSHDRYFLDQVVTRIAEIDHGAITDYAGNYTYYVKEKELRRAAQQAAYERQQEEISRIEAFAERFRYKATKAAQVQSRLKGLEKIERLPPPTEPQRSIRFRFPEPLRSGDLVMELLDIAKSYGHKTVFSGVNLNICRGDKIALVGPNGAGKSTLMRLLAGQEAADRGTRRLGHQALPSYFAQDQARTLTPGITLLEELGSSAPLAGESLLRNLLGSFLFSGEDVYKKTEVLSGGEKNRLALCKLLASPGNLLLLDEPTNHLDMSSKDVLLDALKAFTGTVVFVSHDRYFLEDLATQVVDVGDGRAELFPGNYPEFVERKRRMAEADAADSVRGRSGGPLNQAGQGSVARATPAKVESGDAYRERKKATRQISRMRERIEQIQLTIEANEKRMTDLVDAMHDPAIAREYAKLQELESQRSDLGSEVDALYLEWESLSAELEASE